VTFPENPRLAGSLPIAEAGELYVARTYAYVPAGSQGLAIVNVERPSQPVLYTMYNAEGVMNDTRSVRVGGTYGRRLRLRRRRQERSARHPAHGPNENPYSTGFSPPPSPRLIATPTPTGEALTLSKGMDRDRAVDESGNQIAVWGRLGSRPFNRQEMEELFLRNGQPLHRRRRPTRQGERVRPPVEPETGRPRRRRPSRATAGAQARAPATGSTVICPVFTTKDTKNTKTAVTSSHITAVLVFLVSWW
jgi:hypothetical protein